jgi:hypothetical protein
VAVAVVLEVLLDLGGGEAGQQFLGELVVLGNASRSRWCSYMRMASNAAAPASSS